MAGQALDELGPGGERAGVARRGGVPLPGCERYHSALIGDTIAEHASHTARDAWNPTQYNNDATTPAINIIIST